MEPIPTDPLDNAQLSKLLELPTDQEKPSHLNVAIFFEFSGWDSCGIGICAKIQGGSELLLYEASYPPFGGDDSLQLQVDREELDQEISRLKTGVSSLQAVGRDSSLAENRIDYLMRRSITRERLTSARRDRSQVVEEVKMILMKLGSCAWKINYLVDQQNLLELTQFVSAEFLHLIDVETVNVDNFCVGLSKGLGCIAYPSGCIVNRYAPGGPCSALQVTRCQVEFWEQLQNLCSDMMSANSAVDRNKLRRRIVKAIGEEPGTSARRRPKPSYSPFTLSAAGKFVACSFAIAAYIWLGGSIALA
jgi:hypothetical protein